MPDITSIARWLIILGLILAALGGVLLVLNRLGWPIGRLPGDFQFKFGETSCFIPIASSILFSLLLTLILNLIFRWLK